MEGSGAELWSASHAAGCRRGSHNGAPTMVRHHGSAPSRPSVGVLPHTSKDSAMTKGGGVLQLLEEGLALFGGGRRAWGPENTFMWQRQGAGVSVSHPGCPPKWQQWGQPLAGLSADPTSDRLALTGPSQAPSASVGGCWGLGGLRQLGQFVQCSSESRLRRRAARPLPDTCHSNHHRELFTPGPVGRASGEGLAVPTASTQLPVTPVTTFWGQQQG